MQLEDYYGYVCHLGLWLGLFMLLSGRVMPLKVSRLLLLPLVILLLLPLPEISLVEMSRGVIGDLSVPTLVLLYLAIAKRLQWLSPVSVRSMQVLSLQVLVIGLLFYPPSLGLTWFDLYSLGYQPHWVLIPVLALALASWWQGLYWWVGGVGLGMLAFAGGLLESNNLWDYLLDPLLVIYCAGYLLIGVGKNLVQIFRGQAASKESSTT